MRKFPGVATPKVEGRQRQSRRLIGTTWMKKSFKNTSSPGKSTEMMRGLGETPQPVGVARGAW